MMPKSLRSAALRPTRVQAMGVGRAGPVTIQVYTVAVARTRRGAAGALALPLARCAAACPVQHVMPLPTLCSA